eukprot:3634115-Alexandrium_andersonii.AAC.1
MGLSKALLSRALQGLTGLCWPPRGMLGLSRALPGSPGLSRALPGSPGLSMAPVSYTHLRAHETSAHL